MKRLVVILFIIAITAVPAMAASPSEAIPGELLAGGLGSALGWGGGFLVGRALTSALDLESQPDWKDLVTVGTLAMTVTAGASLGVIIAGSYLGVDGNELLCAGGALLGMAVGMVVEPILGMLFTSVLPSGAIEIAGFAAMVAVPAVGATIGFNIGATER